MSGVWWVVYDEWCMMSGVWWVVYDEWCMMSGVWWVVVEQLLNVRNTEVLHTTLPLIIVYSITVFHATQSDRKDKHYQSNFSVESNLKTITMM